MTQDEPKQEVIDRIVTKKGVFVKLSCGHLATNWLFLNRMVLCARCVSRPRIAYITLGFPENPIRVVRGLWWRYYPDSRHEFVVYDGIHPVKSIRRQGDVHATRTEAIVRARIILVRRLRSTRRMLARERARLRRFLDMSGSESAWFDDAKK